MEYVANCTFGAEAVLKREMLSLDYTITRSENGRIYFDGTIEKMIHANMALRTADRIFIVLGSSRTLTFDHLYDYIRQLSLKPYLGKYGKFIITAKSVQSKLYSLRDIQKIAKKALVDNLKYAYDTEELPETKEPYNILINIQKDTAEIWLDTSGDPLHKRGYRLHQGEAPIKETLAATMILLSFYDKTRALYDPFCGSGTFAIEAAMIAKNIAPNLNRTFALESFYWMEKSLVRSVRAKLLKAIDQDVQLQIVASDIDHRAIAMAVDNAKEAGVDDCISFEVCDFVLQSFHHPNGIIITNPPYGHRMQTDDEAEKLYHAFAKVYKQLNNYSLFMISAYPGIEGIFQKKANRTRVLFNGNIKSRYYQFYGSRPE